MSERRNSLLGDLFDEQPVTPVSTGEVDLFGDLLSSVEEGPPRPPWMTPIPGAIHQDDVEGFAPSANYPGDPQDERDRLIAGEAQRGFLSNLGGGVTEMVKHPVATAGVAGASALHYPLAFVDMLTKIALPKSFEDDPGPNFITALSEGTGMIKDKATEYQSSLIDDPHHAVGAKAISETLPDIPLTAVGAGAGLTLRRMGRKMAGKPTVASVGAIAEPLKQGSETLGLLVTSKDYNDVIKYLTWAPERHRYIPKAKREDFQTLKEAFDRDMLIVDEMAPNVKRSMYENLGLKTAKVGDYAGLDKAGRSGFSRPADVEELQFTGKPGGNLWQRGKRRWFSRPGSRPDLVKRLNVAPEKLEELSSGLTNELAQITENADGLTAHFNMLLLQRSEDLNSALRKITKDPAERERLMQVALKVREGKVDPSVLPPRVAEAAKELGNLNDDFTRLLAEQGLITADEMAYYQKSFGKYTKNIYNFRRKGVPWDPRDTDIEDNLVEYFKKTNAKRHGPEGTDPWDDDQVRSHLREMLDDEKVMAALDAPDVPKDKKIGAFDMGWSIRRKRFAKQFKEYMGLSKRLDERSELGIRAVSRDIVKQNQQRETLDLFKRMGLASDSPPRSGDTWKTVPVGAGPSLREVRVHPEVADALDLSEDFNVDFLQELNGAFRAANTIGTPMPTGARNGIANLSDLGMIGHGFRPSLWMKYLPESARTSAEVLVGKVPRKSARERELNIALHGMHNVDPLTGDLRRYHELGSKGSVGAFLKKHTPEPIKKAWNVASGTMGRSYSETDVMFKRATSRMLEDDYQRILPQMNDAERAYLMRTQGSLDPAVLASQEVKDTMQTYTRVSEGVKSLTDNKYVGMFPSFGYESRRNVIANVRWIEKDLDMAINASTPAVRQFYSARAMRRTIGMASWWHVPDQAKRTVEGINGTGFDEQESAAFEDVGLRPYHQGGDYIILERDENGVTYLPLSAMDYGESARRTTNLSADIIGSINRGDVSTGRSMLKLLDNEISELAGYEGGFKSLVEAATNTRMEDSPMQTALLGTNRPRITYATNKLDSFEDKFMHVASEVLPSGSQVSRARRNLEAGEGPWGAAKPFLPFAPIKIDYETQLAVDASKMRQRGADFSRALNRIAEGSYASPAKAREELDKLEADWENSLVPELQRLTDSWSQLVPGLTYYNAMAGAVGSQAAMSAVGGKPSTLKEAKPEAYLKAYAYTQTSMNKYRRP